jgi:hypothetical protein
MGKKKKEKKIEGGKRKGRKIKSGISQHEN